MVSKAGGGQTGNGGGGGGNDTPDPEYSISADFVGDPLNCLAYNPDLKGPGIAFGGFYDYDGVAPFTCASVTTTGGESFYVRTLGIVVDETGKISAVWLRGRDADNVLFDGAEVAVSAQAPLDGDSFDLDLDVDVPVEKCQKVKGKTSCTPVGSVHVGTLVYVNIGF